jgi:hypothetical protein
MDEIGAIVLSLPTLFRHTHGIVPADAAGAPLRTTPPLRDDAARAAARCLPETDEMTP